MNNKVALVVGGSGGIGSSICKRLIREGIKVYFTYLNSEDRARTLEKEMNDQEEQMIAIRIKCDITQYTSVKSTIQHIIEHEKKIDILVNCAGISEEVLFANKEIESWDKVIATNLTSVFYTCREVIPYMLDEMEGVIVNISSILGNFGIPGMVDYCAAKSGVNGLTKSLAAEVARFGIRVNAVSPGMMDTTMTSGAQQQIGKSVKKLIPMRRFGLPEEVADVVAFIISEDARYMTGENIAVSGGLGQSLPVS